MQNGNQVISKQELEGWKENLKGKVRGVALQGYREFISKEEGPEALKNFEEEISKITDEFDLENIEAMKFYPYWYFVSVLETIKRMFDYNDEKFVEIGRFNIKTSLLIRSSLKYFLSLEKVLAKTPDLWEKYLTTGSLNIKECNEEEKRVVIQIKDYYTTPVHCHILRGYFSQALQMVLKAESTCEETKCCYSGGDCHEFVVTW